ASTTMIRQNEDADEYNDTAAKSASSPQAENYWATHTNSAAWEQCTSSNKLHLRKKPQPV
ncbi:hypothetical protein, partial [Corynebacterium ammoniagenes]